MEINDNSFQPSPTHIQNKCFEPMAQVTSETKINLLEKQITELITKNNSLVLQNSKLTTKIEMYQDFLDNVMSKVMDKI